MRTSKAARASRVYDVWLGVSAFVSALSLFFLVAMNQPRDSRPDQLPPELRVAGNQRFFLYSDPPNAKILQENPQQTDETLRGYTNNSQPFHLSEFDVNGQTTTFRLAKEGYRSEVFTIPVATLKSGMWPPKDEEIARLEPVNFLTGARLRHPVALGLLPLGVLLSLTLWALKEREHRRLRELEEMLAAAGDDPFVGRRVSEYRVLERIGAGAFGLVYRAAPEGSSRTTTFALKVLPYEGLEKEQIREAKVRFEREMALLKDLQHENVGKVIDYGQTSNYDWVLMPLYEGGTLKQRLKGERLSSESILEVAEQIALALTAVHDLGACHRDLKPENVMLDGRRAVLIDFGIARVEGKDTLTAKGSTLGTPLYMAPEQIDQSKVDARADQYAYGVLLFEMLTGRLPFNSDGSEPFAILAEKFVGRSLLLRQVDPEQDEAMEIVLARMLATDPGQRFSSVWQAFEAFRAALHTTKV